MSNIITKTQVTKICSRCHQKKKLNEFYKDNYSPDGFCYNCKLCHQQIGKEYRSKNPEYSKRYLLKNKNTLFIKHQKYQLENALISKFCSKCNKEKTIKNFCKCKMFKDGLNYICRSCIKQIDKKRHLKNSKEINQKNKQRRLENPEKTKQYKKTYNSNPVHKEERNHHEKQRLKVDPCYKLSRYLRTNQYIILKRNIKSGHSINLLMCSFQDFKLYIEKQWLLGMNWDNWGNGPGKWNIDHIIPCSFFHMLDAVEQHMCFRWQNQRPIWWTENNQKSDKIIYHPSNTAKLI